MKQIPEFEMPKHHCTATAEAAKIVRIVPPPVSQVFVEVGEKPLPIAVGTDFLQTEKPKLGDYLIRYPDGMLVVCRADYFAENWEIVEPEETECKSVSD